MGDCPFKVMSNYFITLEQPPYLFNYFLAKVLVAMLRFFQQFGAFLGDEKLVLIIDEFDGIPRDAVSGFLHALRTIYVQRSMRECPYSIGIVGVKNITQLNLNRSISPFNIQDEFTLPNFTFEQVHDLLAQHTDEVGQTFAPEVIENIHRQTAGQPFLVNRFRAAAYRENEHSENRNNYDDALFKGTHRNTRRR